MYKMRRDYSNLVVSFCLLCFVWFLFLLLTIYHEVRYFVDILMQKMLDMQMIIIGAGEAMPDPTGAKGIGRQRAKNSSKE